jgi:hypothetical protein
MPNRRAAGLVLIGFHAEQELVDRIDEDRGLGTREEITRSDWLRFAACKWVVREGVDLPEKCWHKRSQIGKGGPKRKDQVCYIPELKITRPYSMNDGDRSRGDDPK